jgi:hypothetical protein
MWSLVSRINLKGTRRRVGRRVVAAAVVLGTGVQMAMVVLPNPAAASAGAPRPTSSHMCEVPAAPEARVG